MDQDGRYCVIPHRSPSSSVIFCHPLLSSGVPCCPLLSSFVLCRALLYTTGCHCLPLFSGIVCCLPPSPVIPGGPLLLPQEGLHCADLSSLVVLAAPHRALLRPLSAENTAHVRADVEKYLTRIHNPGRQEPLSKGQAK